MLFNRLILLLAGWVLVCPALGDTLSFDISFDQFRYDGDADEQAIVFSAKAFLDRAVNGEVPVQVELDASELRIVRAFIAARGTPPKLAAELDRDIQTEGGRTYLLVELPLRELKTAQRANQQLLEHENGFYARTFPWDDQDQLLVPVKAGRLSERDYSFIHVIADLEHHEASIGLRVSSSYYADNLDAEPGEPRLVLAHEDTHILPKQLVRPKDVKGMKPALLYQPVGLFTNTYIPLKETRREAEGSRIVASLGTARETNAFVYRFDSRAIALGSEAVIRRLENERRSRENAFAEAMEWEDLFNSFQVRPYRGGDSPILSNCPIELTHIPIDGMSN